MSMFARLAKWKMRWAVFSGIMSLIVWPIVRLVFKRKSKTTAGKTSNGVIDVHAEEVNGRDGSKPV